MASINDPTILNLVPMLLGVIFALVAGLLLVPCLVFWVECVAAATWRPPTRIVPRPTEGLLAVLIPAHNEASGIQRTLETIQPQLRAGDRLIVVADNCTDSTAELARSLGATVLERQNLQQRGKGYALDYGLAYLCQDPPALVCLFDADCDVHPYCIDALAATALATGRPTQANYLIEKPREINLKGAISAFAIKVKNWVRPLGLWQLAQPCLITGAGIAVPWPAIASVNLASSHIVEDMKLGLDLALAGYPPIFCPTAKVTSRLPQNETAAKGQRTRWEHGHLQVMAQYLPKLLGQLRHRPRISLVSLMLELAIPPLSLLILIWVGITMGMGLVAGLGLSGIPLILALVAGIALFGGVAIAWMAYGQSDISLKELALVPVYILWKIPLYLKFLARPEKEWIRTERDS